MKKATRILLSVFASSLIVACTRVPGYVVKPDKMAEVMADLHTAECVVDMNYAKYNTDSLKQVLKQSVLAKHGITTEQLDTSFMWYGAHLDKYIDVYEGAEEILKKRLEENGAIAAAAASASVSGDSVDVWNGSRMLAVAANSPSRYVVFSLKKDANWKPGDNYTWKGKFFNNTQGGRWGIIVEYDDGDMELLNVDFNGDGWKELAFVGDTTRMASNIYGVLEMNPQGTTRVYVDSMQLVRGRHDPNRQGLKYRQRIYRIPK